MAGQHDADGRMLAIGQVAAADLEQPHGRDAALQVARARRQQAGQQRRPHDLQVFADRVGEAPRAPAERRGLRFAEEAPRHRLVQPARGGGAADAAFQLLFGRGGRARDAGRARQRDGRDLVDPLDADHFLDQIGGAVDIAAPRRHGDRPVAVDREAEPFEDVALPLRRHGKAAQRFGA